MDFVFFSLVLSALVERFQNYTDLENFAYSSPIQRWTIRLFFEGARIELRALYT